MKAEEVAGGAMTAAEAAVKDEMQATTVVKVSGRARSRAL